MTPKKFDNSAKAQKILEMIFIDCIKVIRPDLLDKQLSAFEFFTEHDELIFDRMVFDKLSTIIDLLQHDLGHINDATRLMLSMDYEDALNLFKRTL